MSNYMNKPVEHVIAGKQGGAAMVEFAVILPLVILLLFGFTEFGRMLYQQNVLTKALASGSRFVSRSPEALTIDCAPGPNWAGVTTQASDLVVFSQTGEPRLPGLNDAGAVTFSSTAQAIGGGTACVIKGAARTEFTGVFGERLVPFMSAGSIVLSALDEERYVGQ
jgi:Flp pilus assembly protein TadG